MKNDDPTAAADLRRRAEARLAAAGDEPPEPTPDELRQVVHELRTQKIELEKQNDELRRAQAELAESRDRFSNLFDFAPVGYATLSAKGLIVNAAKAIGHRPGTVSVAVVARRCSEEFLRAPFRMAALKSAVREALAD